MHFNLGLFPQLTWSTIFRLSTAEKKNSGRKFGSFFGLVHFAVYMLRLPSCPFGALAVRRSVSVWLIK